MDKNSVQKTITELREKSKKRNFSQAFDFVMTLKDINLKNTDEQVDFFVQIPFNLGKKMKVAALAGPELAEKAKKLCDLVVLQDEFNKYKDKKLAKKLATEYDFFISQAEIMPKVAAAFGRALGPRGKMPNPKLGSIVPGKAQLEPLMEKLQKTVRISAKKSPMIQVKVGTESMKDEEIIENIMTIHNQIVNHLPKEAGNVKQSMLKLTMSAPIKIK